MSRSAVILVHALVTAGQAVAQQSTPVPNDTATALVIKPARTLRFTTEEGTWISLDVSPDGTSRTRRTSST